MYVEITKNFETIGSPERFAIQDLTANELELFQEGLIELKNNKLKDPEAFKDDRRSCVEMFQKIDSELVKSKS